MKAVGSLVRRFILLAVMFCLIVFGKALPHKIGIFIERIYVATVTQDADNFAEYEATRTKAEHGSAMAQYDLGRMFEVGRGVKRDTDLAALWYRRSADNGNRDAKDVLSDIEWMELVGLW